MLAPPAPAPVLDLSLHADLTAVLLDDSSAWSYRELSSRVDARAMSWGPERRLVLLEARNDPDSLVSYLAALNHGHVAMVVPDGRPDHLADLVATYDPDIVCSSAEVEVRREASVHDLHPDLALLLSTSGSTGSPKLVRLSRDNVLSNAESIASSLGLTADDRAITTLPLHYCYGLSVLHSHLLVGAGIVLTDTSVVDPCFWDLFSRSGATSFAGVPYTFELLERSGFSERDLPTLRQITQAGGRLAPDRVKGLASLGAERSWDLVVMYGQTEATARMAYLPPHLTLDHPHAIGIAIPGGELRVEPVPESKQAGVGELVYTGPNVMMGYARTREDLGRGPELCELRTGDLAREVDGIFEVVGRRDRSVKIFGLRIDLERVERRLTTAGISAACVASENHLHVFGTDGRTAPRIRETVAEFCGIPLGAVRVHVLPDLPLTSSGKVDHALLRAHAEASAPEIQPRSAKTVLEHFALVLGRPDAAPHDTFVALGGDSLSYVELATRLESLLPGGLPVGWHQRSIDSLTNAPDLEPVARRARWRLLDTTVAIRAVAIILIVASHVDLIAMEGGAHLLLILAGFNFARFQLGTSSRRTRIRHGLAGLAQLVVPSVLWIGTMGLLLGTYTPATALFLNGMLGSKTWNDQWQFWFLEALVWATLAAIAVVAVPRLHRAELKNPFGFPLTLLAGASVLRFAQVGITAGPTERYTITVVAFFFVLGWLGARATTIGQRLLVTVLAVGLVAWFFGQPAREAIILGGFVLVLWVPRLRCIPVLDRFLGALAAASLSIYLTQWQVYPPLEDAGHPVLAMVATFAFGLLYAAAMRPVQRRLGYLLRTPRHRPNSLQVSVGQATAEHPAAAR